MHRKTGFSTRCGVRKRKSDAYTYTNRAFFSDSWKTTNKNSYFFKEAKKF